MSICNFPRKSAHNSFEIINIEKPYSFFNLVESKFSGLFSIRRLLSQIRVLGGKTMILENIDFSTDIIHENEDLKILLRKEIDTKLIRLSFFTKSFKTIRGFKSTENKQFLGYIIIKKDYFSSNSKLLKIRVYESVISRGLYPNNFIRGEQKWSCNIIGKKFSIHGYLYAQQNNMTNVCAHVALRTVISRYHPDGDISYRTINELLGIDHIHRKLGNGKGLSTDEMIKAIEHYGANCFVGNYTSNITPPVPFQKYIYGSIESGFPSLVVFATQSSSYHAIPIFGHTFNEDTWVPNAEFSYFKIGKGIKYIPSESWLSMYIAHDDNWGSNYCIPRRYLHTQKDCDVIPGTITKCKKEPEGVAYTISTFPKEILMSPIHAEALAADFLFSILQRLSEVTPIWGERLKNYSEHNLIVIRPILVSNKEYINHLSTIKDWHDNSIKEDILNILTTHLNSSFYWLIEISLPELFSANRRKVGEIIIRSDIKPPHSRSMDSFVFARIPGFVTMYSSGDANNPEFSFIQSGIDSHTPLYGTH